MDLLMHFCSVVETLVGRFDCIEEKIDYNFAWTFQQLRIGVGESSEAFVPGDDYIENGKHQCHNAKVNIPHRAFDPHHNILISLLF